LGNLILGFGYEGKRERAASFISLRGGTDTRQSTGRPSDYCLGEGRRKGRRGKKVAPSTCVHMERKGDSWGRVPLSTLPGSRREKEKKRKRRTNGGRKNAIKKKERRGIDGGTEGARCSEGPVRGSKEKKGACDRGARSAEDREGKKKSGPRWGVRRFCAGCRGEQEERSPLATAPRQ